MTQEVLEEQIEFLLSAALGKCGDPYEAEDLTQDTLLAALKFEGARGVITRCHKWR